MFHLYEISGVGKSTETRQISGCQGGCSGRLGEEEKRTYGVSFWVDENVMELDCDGFINTYQMLLNCIL